MRKAMCILLLGACSGAQVTSTCHATVSGQLMGKFDTCDDFDSRYLSNVDTFNFSADYLSLPTVFTFSTAWALSGEPSAKVYSETTQGIDCNITMKQGMQTWTASKGEGSVASGNCALDFTVPDAGVVDIGNDGNVTAYHVTGRLTGHLEAMPDTGSSGTVDVTLDFDGSGALR